MKKLIMCFMLFAVCTLTSCSNINLDAIFGESTTTTTNNENNTTFGIQEQIYKALDTIGTSTVGVTVYDSYKNIISTGSGVIYKKVKLANGYKYYVVTNYHVVKDFSILQITLGLNDSATGKFIGFDFNNDIAVIAFESLDRYDVAKTSEKTVQRGQFVFAVGCPLGMDQFNSISFGVVSCLHKFDDLIQTDAALNPGNSGGGLFTLNGEFIGLIVSKNIVTVSNGEEVPIEGMGFAIDVNIVYDITEEIEIRHIIEEIDELKNTTEPVSDTTITSVNE